MIITLTFCLRWFGLMPSYLLLDVKNWEDNMWNGDCVTDENATRLSQQLLTILSSIWHVKLLAQSGMNQDQQSRLRKNDIYNSILLYPMHQGALHIHREPKKEEKLDDDDNDLLFCQLIYSPLTFIQSKPYLKIGRVLDIWARFCKLKT